MGFTDISTPISVTMTTSQTADSDLPLPLADPLLADPDLDLHTLIEHWAARSALPSAR